MKAKILCFDIETLPCTGYFWGPGYKMNVGYHMVEGHRQMAMWSAKYVDSAKMYTMNGHEHGHYQMLEGLWNLLDEADIVVAHNGDNFDRKWCNTEFLLNSFDPPDPSKWVDTLKTARGHFNFESNRMDDLADLMGVGRKIKTEFSLWTDWMKGDKKAVKEMTKYCNQDVKVLQSIYYKLRPWMSTHPNVALYKNNLDRPTCGRCGSIKVTKKGMSYTNSGIYQRYRCNDCGTPLKGKKTVLDKESSNNALRNEGLK